MNFKSSLIAAAIALTGVSAHAGLVGQTINHELATQFSGGGPFDPGIATWHFASPVVVGSGNEFTNVFGNTVDFSDSAFVGTFNSGHGAFSFNGFIYRLVNPTVAFTSVTFQSSTIAGFDASRLSFNSGAIALNMSGLSAVGNVKFSFNTSPIPEPETYALMLAGLGAIGVVARRRKTV